MKQILSILLLFCFLCAGCSKPHAVKTRPAPVPVQSQTTKYPTHIHTATSLKDMPKEKLEQGMKECEDYLAIYFDVNRDTTPEEEMGKALGMIGMPVVYMYYFAAKIEYIQRYGTSEQKEALKALPELSSFSPEDQKLIMDLLEMPDYMSQSLILKSPLNNIQIDNKKVEELLKKVFEKNVSAPPH